MPLVLAEAEPRLAATSSLCVVADGFVETRRDVPTERATEPRALADARGGTPAAAAGRIVDPGDEAHAGESTPRPTLLRLSGGTAASARECATGTARYARVVERSESRIEETLAAIERQDWEALELLLHPYVHWTTRKAETVRGRRQVISRLASAPVPAAPASYELRDGQVYRWSEGSP